jgi:hypothetical protein
MNEKCKDLRAGADKKVQHIKTQMETSILEKIDKIINLVSDMQKSDSYNLTPELRKTTNQLAKDMKELGQIEDSTKTIVSLLRKIRNDLVLLIAGLGFFFILFLAIPQEWNIILVFFGYILMFWFTFRIFPSIQKYRRINSLLIEKKLLEPTLSDEK